MPMVVPRLVSSITIEVIAVNAVRQPEIALGKPSGMLCKVI